MSNFYTDIEQNMSDILTAHPELLPESWGISSKDLSPKEGCMRWYIYDPTTDLPGGHPNALVYITFGCDANIGRFTVTAWNPIPLN